MTLGQLATESSQTLQTGALQFGGDLIGLAILFLVLALIAGVLGAGNIAGLSMDIAKWLVIIFVVLAVLTFLL